MNRDVVKIAFAIVAIENIGIVGKVSLEGVEIAIEVDIPNCYPHTSLLQSIFAERDAAFESLLAKSAIVLITKQPARSGITGDVNVGPAVVIVIGCNACHGIGTSRGRHSTLFTDISKSAVPVVMKKLHEACWQASGTAVHRNAFPGAVRIRAGFGQIFESSAEVVGHKEIEVPVAVVIDPGAARAVADGTL